MSGLAIQYTVTLEEHTCGECGITFAAPVSFWEERRRSYTKDWYCPNGHNRHFIGETEAEKLARELEAERRRVAFEQNRAQQLEKDLGKLRKRIANGVCPECHRSFTNLRRHMATKHHHGPAPKGKPTP
jgi:hypothetical protein